MPATDWRKLTREPAFDVQGDAISVRLEGERGQQVFVEDANPALLRVWSVAARPAMLQQLEEGPDLYAWGRNRLSDLVGFKTDSRGRLIGEAWVPTEGLDAGEGAVYVRAVALACDRVEYLLSGKDEG